MIGLDLTEIISIYCKILLGSAVFGFTVQFLVFGTIKVFSLVSIINH